MSGEETEKSGLSGRVPRVKGWFVLLSLVTLLVGYAYHLYRENREIFINAYYFRTLQELATELDNNLDQLHRLLRYGESENTIQSIFPSFSLEQADKPKTPGKSKEEGAGVQQDAGLDGSKLFDSGAVETAEEPLPESDAETLERRDPHGSGNVVVPQSCERPGADPSEGVTRIPLGPGVEIKRIDRERDDLLPVPAFHLRGEQLEITQEYGTEDEGAERDGDEASVETGNYVYLVDFEDLLPDLPRGFVQLVVADSANRVLASSAGAAGLSITDTRLISQELQTVYNQDWLELAAGKGGPEADPDVPLPGYSTYADIDLTTGKSRVFVQPFQLKHPIQKQNSGNGVGGASAQESVLYLIGVRPQSVIEQQESKRWNISLLLLSLVALVFLWTVTRLLMLSRHQPIADAFYRVTILTSYLMFISLLALLLASGARDREVALKHAAAQQLMQRMAEGLNRDIHGVFDQLKDFHQYYARLIVAGEEQAVPSEYDCLDCRELTWFEAGVGSELGGSLISSLRLLNGTVIRYRGADSNHQPDRPGFEIPDRDCQLLSDPRSRTVREKSLAPFSFINVFPADATVEAEEQLSEWFTAPAKNPREARAKLLDVFLMNDQGRQVLPMFYFTESNRLPDSYDVSKRDYFRKVLDQSGWNMSFNAPVLSCPYGGSCAGEKEARGGGGGAKPELSLDNFYIQRLLNLNTGTRGTTLGMPLCPQGWCRGDLSGREQGYFLGSDIVLPSLSLTAWDDPLLLQDMVPMVVDRTTGQVLFHLDDRRAMIENLYRSGEGAERISLLLQSGRLGRGAVPGYYHGLSGDFLSRELPISQWALVLFLPDANTASLMTQVFLACWLSIGAIVSLIAAALYLRRRLEDPESVRARFGLPPAVTRHEFMVFTTIFVSSIYVAYRLGLAVELYPAGGSLTGQLLRALVMLLVPAATLGVGLYCLHKQRDEPSQEPGGKAMDEGGRFLSLRGAGDRLLAGLAEVRPVLRVFVALGILVTLYLLHIGRQPDGALAWYYKSNLYPARLNQEYTEISDIARTLYPNSIGQHGQNPLALMPISQSWRQLLEEKAGRSDGSARSLRQQHVYPDGVGTFSQLTLHTGVYDWVRRYLLNLSVGGGASDRPYAACLEGWPMVRHLLVMLGGFALLCWLWTLFHRRVVRARLTGGEAFIEHINYIIEHNRPQFAYSPCPTLELDLRCEPVHVDAAHGSGGVSAGRPAMAYVPAAALPPEVRSAWEKSCSALFSESLEATFPGMAVQFWRLPVCATTDVRCFGVHLSNLEFCLSHQDQRRKLLQLLRCLRELHDRGALGALSISLGFHAYEALILKAHSMAGDERSILPEEFSDWAVTLMDFAVVLPEELIDKIDRDFERFECEGSLLLRNMAQPGDGAAAIPWPSRRRWQRLRDIDKTAEEWATINCILLRAGALFRQKWETCSNSEKLALYYLARNKRVNTANVQLLEQLALQGLIRVDQSRIRILNHSLAYFVRHAEDADTLQQLVKSGDLGAWKEYRAPVTVVVLLLLGAIAVSSGASVYLIVASLLGLLGTLGSLVGSASMIREHLR